MKIIKLIILILFLVPNISMSTCYDQISDTTKSTNPNLINKINKEQNKLIETIRERNGVATCDYSNLGMKVLAMAVPSLIFESFSLVKALTMKYPKRFIQRSTKSGAINFLNNIVRQENTNDPMVINKKFLSSDYDFKRLQRSILVANELNMFCGSTNQFMGLSQRMFMNESELRSMLSSKKNVKNFIKEVERVEKSMLGQLATGESVLKKTIPFFILPSKNGTFVQHNLYKKTDWDNGKHFSNVDNLYSRGEQKIGKNQILSLAF
ncbi:MAG: hypothetical protein HQK51_04215 [Oligoflexia bacterium]|nr:hypothetical protein [Oligoflexia bacterium]